MNLNIIDSLKSMAGKRSTKTKLIHKRVRKKK